MESVQAADWKVHLILSNKHQNNEADYSVHVVLLSTEPSLTNECMNICSNKGVEVKGDCLKFIRDASLPLSIISTEYHTPSNRPSAGEPWVRLSVSPPMVHFTALDGSTPYDDSSAVHLIAKYRSEDHKLY